MRLLQLSGSVPPEVWNRLGTKVLPKLRSRTDLRIGVDFSVRLAVEGASGLADELRQALQELGLNDTVRVKSGSPTSAIHCFHGWARGSAVLPRILLEREDVAVHNRVNPVRSWRSRR